MESFRTELENPVVAQDILELERKIYQYHHGEIDEDRFRSLRLARGVYGQRQPGVQMIRIKLPYGKLTSRQLERIAAVSDKYSTGKLHITTRQDIQIHYVSLDRTPELWAELERDDITLREACGNTVRNVTASESAGIDPQEPFDVTPYAHATFQYFLRNPVCGEMGRKFKISFSATDADDAFSYIHDLGFIPVIREEQGQAQRGFRVALGGGLGSQPRHATGIDEFLPEDQLIPFTEAVLRVFDRYGERNRRMKARLKFLLKELGVEEFLRLVALEKGALPYQRYPIDTEPGPIPVPALSLRTQPAIPSSETYARWKQYNVLPQKQPGLFAVGIKVRLGDFSSDQARALAALIRDHAGDELRLSIRQNILIRHVPEARLPLLFAELTALQLADPGYNRVTDITACPGTDTCNLAIANSTDLSVVLEQVIAQEFPELVDQLAANIKISGCMNSCGQHMMAHIGFQGMSLKSGERVAPALQVLLGGGVLGNGKGRFAEKVIKIPTRRAPEALRQILRMYKQERQGEDDFLALYDRLGKRYFYDLLKPLGDSKHLSEADFTDWGQTVDYEKAIGVGECAGVVIDLIQTLLQESREKVAMARTAFEKGAWADSIYHAYSVYVNTAKALLTAADIESRSQAAVIRNFQTQLVDTQRFPFAGSFSDAVYQIQRNAPGEAFAQAYAQSALEFLEAAEIHRQKELSHV